MQVLITGNMGYVGPAVVAHLRRAMPDCVLVGYDSGLFGPCLTTTARLPESRLDAQHFGDVRDLPASLLAGVDAVVHLAAVSNDPIGDRFAGVTDEINHRASVALARRAAAAGVRSFVFASSCSVYGRAQGEARHERDATDPLTAYARSKVMAEDGLAGAELGDMAVTCLRFATACGMSDRLRLDLVLNDFVACALASGEITVLSDGSPWRPLIDVQDMALAIEWAVGRPAEQGGRVLRVNVGADAANYRVSELARAVAAAVPGTRVSINADAPPDTRSYRVDFSLFRSLAPDHQPQMSLADSIEGLVAGLRAIGFSDAGFRTSQRIRLNVLAGLIEQRHVSRDLRWAVPSYA